MNPASQSGTWRPHCVVCYGISLLLSALLLTQPRSAAPQAGPSSESSRPSSVVTADRLVDRVVDGEPVTFLLGNVYIDRDTVTVRSDTARFWRDQEVYELWSNVRLRQNQAVLSCERALFRRGDGGADFSGLVRIEDGLVIGTSRHGQSREEGNLLRLLEEARLVSPDFTVWADTIVQDRAQAEGEASGNVKIVDPESETLITGDHATFTASGDSTLVDRNPVLTTREKGAELLEARSREMQFSRQREQGVLIDNVRIRQGRTLAESDTAFTYGRDRLVLRGSPVVRSGDRSTMTGQEIEFRYLQGQLRRILLRGDARMEDTSPDSVASIYVGLPELDVLEGDTITVEIAEGEIQRSVVVGHARSLYVPTDLEGEAAFNDVSGDTIVIFFQNEKVNRVRVKGSMTGTYTFARLQKMSPAGSRRKSTSDTLATAPDSTDVVAASGDTTATSGPTSGWDFDSGKEKVEYSGGALTFLLQKRKIEIDREASITYGTMDLTADEVDFDILERELYATGDPVLEDQSQKLTGEDMGYNFESRTGAVRDGVTTHEKNYYVGRHIRRFGDGSLKIKSGQMTACDLAQPHYHFWSHKMKIKLGDKLAAAPVVLKIGNVPLFALPFYYKSLKTGRRSGILFPQFEFGWSGREGRYIRDFGYYWATNDYTDFVIQGDYNERRDFNFRIINQYVKRYSFRGGLQYTRKVSLGEGPKSREWQFRWNHGQEKLFDYYSLNADVQLASSTLESNDLSRDLGRDIVSTQVRSNLRLSRSWQFMNGTLSLSRDQRVNAEDDDPESNNVLYTQRAPDLSLSFRRLPLKSSLARGKNGSLMGDMLRNTYFNHSYSFSALQQESELTQIDTYNAKGQMKLDLQLPRVGIFNVSTGVSGSYGWKRTTEEGTAFVRYDTLDATADPPVVQPVFDPLRDEETTTSPTLSVNSSLGTTLFGVFPLKLGRLRAIRHQVRLSVGHSYRPRLGDKQLPSEVFNFSMSNRFDLKYLVGGEADSTEQFKKMDGLLDWSLSTSFNPRLPTDQAWNDIGSSLVINPGQSRNLKLNVRNSIDPYELRIKTTNITYGLNLRGRFDTGGEVPTQERQKNRAIELLGAGEDTTLAVEGVLPEEMDRELDPFADEFAGYERARPGRSTGKDLTEGGRYVPWTFNTNLSFNRNHISGSTRANANLSVSATLTRNWDISYRTSLDLDTGAINRQQWDLTRDLHCWRLEFSRIVSNVDSQFAFRIYLVSIPSIKVTRGNDELLGSLGGALSGGLY